MKDEDRLSVVIGVICILAIIVVVVYINSDYTAKVEKFQKYVLEHEDELSVEGDFVFPDDGWHTPSKYKQTDWWKIPIKFTEPPNVGTYCNVMLNEKTYEIYLAEDCDI